MKIYVASSWRNHYHPEVVSALRADGHEVYDFKGSGDGWGSDGKGPGGFGWSEIDKEWEREWTKDIPRYLQALNHPRAIEGFRRDMDALELADACVMVMPCGPSASMEMGWACGAGCFVAVYIPAIREPDLMVKMADLITSDLEEIRAALQGVARKFDELDRKLGFVSEPLLAGRSTPHEAVAPTEAKP